MSSVNFDTEAAVSPDGGGGARALGARYRHLLPNARYKVDPMLVWIIVTHISIVRSLVLSVRFRGWFLLSRRTRLRIGRGSQVTFGPNAFLIVGFFHYGPTPATIHLGRRATMSVEGTVLIRQGARLYVNDDAHLEMHAGAVIADYSTVTCFDHIVIGEGGGTSWYCNVLDTNGHEIIVDGVTKPMTAPVVFGPRVLAGSCVTVLPGVTIGEGSVIAAGSVVTKDIPPHALAGGNPARVIREHVEWVD